MKIVDITGQKFGSLTALYRLHNYHNKKNARWLCVCDCGNLKEVMLQDLKHSKTISCGCQLYKTQTKHNKCDHRLYSIWQNMKNRCYNVNAENYINNDTHCFSEWCEIVGIKTGTAYARLKHGWTIEKALNYGKGV